MLAVVVEGENIQNASEGSRCLFTSTKKSSETSRGEFGKEENNSCLDGELQIEDLESSAP